jgi:DUF4097 and DUF4098 domain-containing protein YvlB
MMITGRISPRIRLLAAFAILAGAHAVHATTASAQRSRTRVVNGNEYRSRIDTTIAFDRSGTISVNAGSGDIIVTGNATNQLHVRASSDDDDIRFDASPNRTTIELSTARRGSDSRFEISVPQGVRVIAKSASGDITIRGTHGEVQATAQSGDMVIEDVNGRLEVKSFSGEVTVANVVGDVEISTQSGDLKLSDVRGNIEVGNTSGDITMRGVTARTVRAKTTSGDVSYEGTIDPAGRYDLESHSGDVRLKVPRDASAQLTVSTWNGEIESDFTMTLKPGQHTMGATNSKEFTFAIGGGSARITAKTFSGDVAVSSNGRGATTRP